MSHQCYVCHKDKSYWDTQPIKVRPSDPWIMPSDDKRVLICHQCLGWNSNCCDKKIIFNNATGDYVCSECRDPVSIKEAP